jgi:hypothetical protein
MKRLLAMAALGAFLLPGCSISSGAGKDNLAPQSEEECVRQCRFRHSLCSVGCERTWNDRGASRYEPRRYRDDHFGCRDRCNEDLQECLVRCSDQGAR